MKGHQYAWEEIRLAIAQLFFSLAIRVTPCNTPEFLVLYKAFKEWGELAKLEKWKQGDK